MRNLFNVRVCEKSPQKLVVSLEFVCEEQGGVVLLLVEPALHTYYVQPRQGQDIHAVLGRPEGQQLLQPDLCGDDLGGTGVFRPRLALGLSLPLGSGEVVLVDELGEFQIQEQLVQSVVVRRLAQVALRVEIDGGVGVDGGQVIGHAGVPLALNELLPGGGLHVHLVQVGIQPVDGGLLGQQGHGRLLPDALHPGDVVRGIPHQGL